MKTMNYLLAALMITAVGCTEREEAKTNTTETEANVETEKAVAYSGDITSIYSGVVEALKTTSLSFAGAGTVTEVLVGEGQGVSKGQLLARMNSATAQNSHQLALASLQQAEDAYRRMKPMKENGTLPEIKWVEIETGLAQAKAATAIAQKAVDDCSLYAPAGGVIGKSSIQAGMNIFPGASALELLNTQSVYVKIPVPENEINSLKKGVHAQIYIAAIDRNMTGTIKEIGVSADPLSHTYPVKLLVENGKKELRPGMICSVKTASQSRQTGLLVSNKALRQDVAKQQFVFVNDRGKARKVPVKTVALVDNKVLVQGELNEGAEVIVSGQQKLMEASPVKVLNL